MLIHPQSLYIKDNSSIVSSLSNIVSPSFYQPTDKNIVPFRVCNVEHMTCEDTSFWVWTFSHHKGWDEAATYAENFQEQEITGPLLSDLDHNALEQCMKITNHSHRAELLSAIRYLFSQSHCSHKNLSSEVQSSASSAHHCGILYPVQLVTNLGSSVYDSQDSLSAFVSQFDCESSVLSTPASWRPVNRRSECGSNISNITCLLSTVGDRSDCESSVALSQNGSFGTDMGSQIQTDTSVISESECCRRISGAEYMDVWESGMSSRNIEYSGKRMHHRNTRDIQMADKSALPVPYGHNKPFSNKKDRSVNLKKLVLALEPDQVPENRDTNITDEIRSWFVELDSAVTVKPMEDEENIYTIIFQDGNAANEALKFRSKGFKIRNKYPPRPCPSNHIKYRALAKLIVRRGKSLRGNLFKGFVERGELVWVDQVKGRRARVRNRGWVSLYSKDGAPLLIQERACESK